ncbi:MAG: helix-turn-helix transcriptional regulator [Coriobacteriia bacterium]|nr:helix-turn-helix transcriptional regulator [Coriobacteriia bacterium]
MPRQRKTLYLPTELLVVFGFALFLALGSTSAWGLLTLSEIVRYSSSQIFSYETTRSIGFLGTLFSLGIGRARVGSLLRLDAAWASAMMWLVGFGGLLLGMFASPRWLFLGEVSSFCLGVAHGLSFVMWQRVFGSVDLRGGEASYQIIAGSALGSVIYLPISLLSDVFQYALSLLVLVVLSTVTLLTCSKRVFRNEFTDKCCSVEVGARGTVGNFLVSSWRYIVCISAIGYASGVSRTIARLGSSTATTLNVVLAIGMLVAALILMPAHKVAHVDTSIAFRKAYMAIFLIVVTGFVPLPFLGDAYAALFAGIANLAFSMVSMFMLITCLRLARLRNMDPAAVFGVFAGLVYTGVLAGRVTGTMVGGAPGASQLLTLVLLSVYILAFVGVASGFSRDAAKMGDADRVISGDALTRVDEASGLARVLPLRPSNVRDSVVVVCDAIPQRCASMRKLYGLSRRETDVLELIIRGRDTSHMAEALFVSENTVRSHCKNLYKKLGVHNRQQLLDAFEKV